MFSYFYDWKATNTMFLNGRKMIGYSECKLLFSTPVLEFPSACMGEGETLVLGWRKSRRSLFLQPQAGFPLHFQERRGIPFAGDRDLVASALAFWGNREEKIANSKSNST